MQVGVDAIRRAGSQDRQEMSIQVVHPARAQQAHQMQALARSLQLAKGSQQGWVAGQAAICCGLADARAVLPNHPSRAQVQVPHL